jgi:hypothetical protein
VSSYSNSTAIACGPVLEGSIEENNDYQGKRRILQKLDMRHTALILSPKPGK